MAYFTNDSSKDASKTELLSENLKQLEDFTNKLSADVDNCNIMDNITTILGEMRELYICISSNNIELENLYNKLNELNNVLNKDHAYKLSEVSAEKYVELQKHCMTFMDLITSKLISNYNVVDGFISEFRCILDHIWVLHDDYWFHSKERALNEEGNDAILRSNMIMDYKKNIKGLVDLLNTHKDNVLCTKYYPSLLLFASCIIDKGFIIDPYINANTDSMTALLKSGVNEEVYTCLVSYIDNYYNECSELYSKYIADTLNDRKVIELFTHMKSFYTESPGYRHAMLEYYHSIMYFLKSFNQFYKIKCALVEDLAGKNDLYSSDIIDRTRDIKRYIRKLNSICKNGTINEGGKIAINLLYKDNIISEFDINIVRCLIDGTTEYSEDISSELKLLADMYDTYHAMMKIYYTDRAGDRLLNKEFIYPIGYKFFAFANIPTEFLLSTENVDLIHQIAVSILRKRRVKFSSCLLEDSEIITDIFRGGYFNMMKIIQDIPSSLLGKIHPDKLMELVKLIASISYDVYNMLEESKKYDIHITSLDMIGIISDELKAIDQNITSIHLEESVAIKLKGYITNIIEFKKGIVVRSKDTTTIPLADESTSSELDESTSSEVDESTYSEVDEITDPKVKSTIETSIPMEIDKI